MRDLTKRLERWWLLRDHWTVRAADRKVAGPRLYPFLLGMDEDGDLYVPSKTRRDWWDRGFNPRSPAHWRYWIASRLLRRIVWLEPYP